MNEPNDSPAPVALSYPCDKCGRDFYVACEELSPALGIIYTQVHQCPDETITIQLTES